jgi:hypothetical protein
MFYVHGIFFTNGMKIKEYCFDSEFWGGIENLKTWGGVENLPITSTGAL